MVITTTQLYSANAKFLAGSGYNVIDITVKSGIRMFAPTWDMVMGHKDGNMSEAEYTSIYHNMMKRSYVNNKASWEALLLTLSTKPIALACFCRPDNFCHRNLLKGYLLKVAKKMEIVAVGFDERD